jgi:nucleoside-diphosphate-sugar epimerase
MKILITGGDGFIGSHLAEILESKGHELVLLDVKFSNNTEGLVSQKVLGDIQDLETFSRVGERFNLIIHTAALSRVERGEERSEECLKINVIGSLNLLKFANNLKPKPHVLFTSSREVYGDPLELPVKEDHPRKPISVYGVSKLAAEELFAYFARKGGLKYTLMRFSNVYGSPRDLPERVIPKFMKSALEDKPITVFGGEQILDFTFIDDVLRGVIRVVEKIENGDESVTNEVFNIASGRGTSVMELANLMINVCNSSSKIEVKPARSFDVRRFIADCSKAKKILGYRPRYSLLQGLKDYKKRLLSQRTVI